MKVQRTVLLETRNIAVGTFAMIALMFAVFICADAMNASVLLGGLYASALAVGNFFALGMTVQSAVGGIQSGDAGEVRRARGRMQLSYGMRMAAMFGLLAVGIAVLGFHPLSSVVPLIFPRIIVCLINAGRSAKGCEGG